MAQLLLTSQFTRREWLAIRFNYSLAHIINRIPLCVRYWATAIRSADKEGKSCRRRSRIRFLWRPPVPLLRRETLSWVDVDDVACVGAQLPRTDPTIAIWRLNLVQRAHTNIRERARICGADLTMRSWGLWGDAIHCFGPVAVLAPGPSGQPDDARALCASKSNCDMQIAELHPF